MTDFFVEPTDTHQFLDPSSSHPYHCKKGIPHSQALRLNRIFSVNESFDKCSNDLEGWLIERGYNGKMIRKQIESENIPGRTFFKEKKHKLPSRN